MSVCSDMGKNAGCTHLLAFGGDGLMFFKRKSYLTVRSGKSCSYCKTVRLKADTQNSEKVNLHSHFYGTLKQLSENK